MLKANIHDTFFNDHQSRFSRKLFEVIDFLLINFFRFVGNNMMTLK